ncbi:MAG TPA: PAS domain S-box protein [Hyphomicrobiaceae bacterium]
MENRVPESETSETILDSIGALVIMLDPAGRILFFNRPCQEVSGYSLDEVKKRHVWDFLLPPEDIEPVKAVFERVKAGDSLGRQTNHWITKEGQRRLIAWSTAAKLGPRSEVQYIIRTGLDLTDQEETETALREREARLQSIIETAPDAIITIDAKGIMESFSPAAERLFGYSAAEAIGQNVNILMPSPYREAHDGYLERYLRTGERRIIGIGRVVDGRRKDGTVFPMELAVDEVRLERRRLFTGFVRDLTARRKIEEELRQSQKMEAVGQLTGGIAHDFNNLLTVIIGNLELMEMRLVRDDDREILKQALEAAELGAQLTDRLLTFARRQALNPKPIDLGEMVLGMSDLLRRSLGESFQISTLLAHGLWMTLADPGMAENALLNLAINARDAMLKGGSLTIETENAELDADDLAGYPGGRPGQYVMLSVTDTGTGMTPEVQQRAFEPFFTTKGTGAGTGLGLSMVYGFVRQSGGHVRLYSELGYGTTVKLYLPRLSEAGSGERQQVQMEACAARGEAILVVEDHPQVRRITVRRMEELGYRVLEADSGQAALDLLEQSPAINLLFTDVVMPGGMTGADLARITRRRWPRVRILFTSGYADPTLISGTEFGHGSLLLRKPYSKMELAHKLREALAGLATEGAAGTSNDA